MSDQIPESVLKKARQAAENFCSHTGGLVRQDPFQCVECDPLTNEIAQAMWKGDKPLVEAARFAQEFVEVFSKGPEKICKRDVSVALEMLGSVLANYPLEEVSDER